jgi:hypothetical protein
MGMNVRNSFEDVCLLRQVHRYSDAKIGLSAEKAEDYRRDAVRYLKVMRGMSDCTWSQDDHGWLSRRNRSLLQQTKEGREELRVFEKAPLLMDGRKDRVTGEVGANRMNNLRLERLSAETQKPIVPMRSYHGKPKTADGGRMRPEEMDADDFRGVENELLLCEGARVLLTQNLWVEAGLMNGALGHVVGYMWPEGGDPHSAEARLQTPLCVFVNFDQVDLGTDEAGRPRSFFPGDPKRQRWFPIFRQRVSSTMEEHVYWENYPVTLAWALTHWKAQGMTLHRVRVHLSDRTAGVPGIGFVACTRVRHPWDLVFEEDLPDYEHFMRARRTPAFRERRRFELRSEARASRTLRRYGYCDADLWSADERAGAEELIRGLKTVASEQRDRMRSSGLRVDCDSWLWGDQEVDYEGELAREVARLAGGDEVRKWALEKVADRLLDRVRVRKATTAECAIADELMDGVELGEGVVSEEKWLQALRGRGQTLAATDVERGRQVREVADKVARCMARHGRWLGEVEDDVPPEIQPLHASAVREALGALIPERLHKCLDAATKRGKDDLGAVRGESVVSMDSWRVSVRVEDALARGRLQEDALEWFRKLLHRISNVMNLPIAIGSVKVGKEAGRQENPQSLGRVMGKWGQVWDREEVRGCVELVLPVALDDRPLPQDWVCVVVRSCTTGETLGAAQQLRVQVYDRAQRSSVAGRVARNISVLLRGLPARTSGASDTVVEFVQVRECRVGSQRILYAYGQLVGQVALAGEVKPLDASGDSYLADVCHASRAVFAYLRRELSERGWRDVVSFLKDADVCRDVLRRLNTVPALVARQEVSERPGVCAIKGSGASVQRPIGVRYMGQAPRVVRVATWNIAGGHRSARAPKTFNALDQRARVVSELLRWSGVFGCDVLALQECEGSVGYEELLSTFELVGSAHAVETRGYVHLYVRRGVTCGRVELGSTDPCVACRLEVADGEGPSQTLVVAAVHLPRGECASQRQRILRQIVVKSGESHEQIVLVGDMNAKDGEVSAMCEAMKLKGCDLCWCFLGRPRQWFLCGHPALGCRLAQGSGALWAKSLGGGTSRGPGEGFLRRVRVLSFRSLRCHGIRGRR